MKKMLSFLYILIFLSSFGGVVGGFEAGCQTRSFEWAHRMGSSGNYNSNHIHENIVGMETDKNGNTYVLSNVLNEPYSVTIDSLLIDDSTRNFYPDSVLQQGGGFYLHNANFACLLSSFDPQGNLRWHKYIISPSAGRISSFIMHKNNIYISSHFETEYMNSYLLIDRDTILRQTPQESSEKSFTLIKYDTSGNYQCLKQFGTEAIQPFVSETVMRMQLGNRNSLNIDENGNLSCLFYFSANLHSFGGANRPYVVVRFDENLNAINGTVLDIGSLQFTSEKFTYGSGKYYLSGNVYDSVVVGNDTLRHDSLWGAIPGFTILAAFNSNGSAHWSKILYKSSLGNAPEMIADSSGNLYLANGSFPHSPQTYPDQPCIGIVGEDTIFLGGSPHGQAFVAKYDSLGNRVWFIHNHPGDSSIFSVPSTSLYSALCFMQGNRIALISGNNKSQIYFDSILLEMQGDEFGWMQMGRIIVNQSTGKILDADYLGVIPQVFPPGGGSPNAGGSHVCSDTYGNMVVAGGFTHKVIFDSITLTNSNYTLSNDYTEDLFITKYAYPQGEYDPYITDSTWVSDTVTPLITDTLYRDSLVTCIFNIDTLVTTTIYADTIIVDTSIVNNSFVCNTTVRDTLVKGGRPGFFAQRETLHINRTLTDTLYTGSYNDSTINLSIPEISSQKHRVEIYPNPAKELLHINNQEQQPLQAELYNLEGKKIKSFAIAAKTAYNLPLYNFNSGIYMLKLQGNGKSMMVKVVIQ